MGMHREDEGSSMKAIIITGRYAQDREVYYPLYRLQEDGVSVDIAVRGNEWVFGVIGEKIVPTMDIPDVLQAQHNLVILPGGARAMEYLRQDERLLNALRGFH